MHKSYSLYSTNRTHKADVRGFTLIELLVVIAIIAMLASIVMASLNSARAKARDSKRIADFKQLQIALELYANDNGGKYPVTGWLSKCAAWTGTDNWIPGLTPTYIRALPTDPGMIAASNINCYIYSSYDSGMNYKLLEYNLSSDVAVESQPSLIDPARNYNQSYPRPSGCSGTETTRTWAIWSGSAAMCW